MKKYLLYIVIFLVGAFAGMWTHRQYHFRDLTKMSQADTLVRYDTIRYSRLELSEKIGRLNVPKITNPRMVLIPADSTTIIYRDSVRYVTMPRQFYFTETEDAQIWHSGIDSTIDSLNVFTKTTSVTKVIQPVTKCNALSIGIETTYMGGLYTPIYIGYERMLKPWMSVYFQVNYDLPTKTCGATAGMKLKLNW